MDEHWTPNTGAKCIRMKREKKKNGIGSSSAGQFLLKADYQTTIFNRIWLQKKTTTKKIISYRSVEYMEKEALNRNQWFALLCFAVLLCSICAMRYNMPNVSWMLVLLLLDVFFYPLFGWEQTVFSMQYAICNANFAFRWLLVNEIGVTT